MTTTDPTPNQRELEALRNTVQALALHVERLTERLDTSDRTADADADARKVPAASRPPAPSEPVDRRTMLRRSTAIAAGAVAGAAALGFGAEPAAAANGANLVLGSASNGATSPTGLTVTGTAQPYGIGATDNGLGSFSGSAAILGHAKFAAFNTGVYGLASGAATGVRGESPESVGVRGVSSTDDGGSFYSDSGTGLRAQSTSGYGAIIGTSNLATPAVQVANLSGRGMDIYGPTPLYLPPSYRAEPTAQTTLGIDRAGYVRVQDARPVGTTSPNSARVWACVSEGGASPSSPGTWRVIAGPDSAGSLHLLPSPVRVYDSRRLTNPPVGVKAPLEANTTRVLDVTANTSGVPTSATGVMVNLLLVNATAGNGNFTLWANGVPKPASNTMVWGGTSGRFSTLAITTLGSSATVQISTSLKTDVVLDVVGYYR